MRKLLLLSFLFFSVPRAEAQQIPAMGIREILKSNAANDTLYIINFWAIWCAPCVQELPVFNSLQEHYAGKPVKVLLVSLDFREDYPMRLGVFLQRKKITPPVIWLSDTNPNEFVPRVDESWEGSIPATLIIHNGKGYRKFVEGQVTERQIATVADMLLE
jgi:thiol-disulfide isomerase/thioredoxin